MNAMSLPPQNVMEVLRGRGLQVFFVDDPPTPYQEFLQAYVLRAQALLRNAAEHHKVADPIFFGFYEFNDFEITTSSLRRTFNAFAGSYRGDMILMSMTVPHVLRVLFNLLLSDPKFLPEMIGTCPPPSMDMKLLGGATLHDFILTRRDAISTPTTPIRRNIAKWLERVAFDFLFFHELGHILNGHTALIQKSKKTLPAMLEEQPTSTGFPLDGIDHQTLEMDADCFAFGEVFGSILFLPSTELISKLLGELDSRAGRLHEVIVVLVATAIYSVWALFGEEEWSLDQIDRLSHPPNAFRQFYSGSWLYSWLPIQKAIYLHNVDDTWNHIHSYLIQGWASVEDSIARIINQPTAWQGLKKASQPQGLAYLDRLTDRWKIKLRAELLTLKKKKGNLAI